MDRRKLMGGGIAAAVLGSLGWMGLRAPALVPQQGRLLAKEVMLIHSPAYRVSAFGLEYLHPFDITRLDRIAGRLARALDTDMGVFASAPAATWEELLEIHAAAYLDRVRTAEGLSQVMETTVPGVLPASVLERRALFPFRAAVGGTRLAMDLALRHGTALHLGGGFHHARPEFGHGFCAFNDIAHALHQAREQGFGGRVLIVDTDAHQGDGNHAFFAADPEVFCLSIHQRELFPDPKIPGDLDIEVSAGVTGPVLRRRLLPEVERVADAFEPDLVFHVAGADVLADDPLTEMALTVWDRAGLDEAVYRALRVQRGVPFVHLLGGGYGPSAAEAQYLGLVNILAAAGVPVTA